MLVSYVSSSRTVVFVDELCSCHISRVVSTAVLSIFLILSAVSTFVFSNRANICVNALMNRFLSVSSPINSSNSSCIQLDNPSKKSKTPSVESASWLFSNKYFSSSLLISSKMSEVSRIFCRLFVQD